MKDFDLRKYLAEGKLLKEEIDSQEKEKYESFKIAMKNEFDGAMDAMFQSPEEYLQDIIDTPFSEFDLGGFFEVENLVIPDKKDDPNNNYYTKKEVIELMKQWAEDKKLSL